MPFSHKAQSQFLFASTVQSFSFLLISHRIFSLPLKSWPLLSQSQIYHMQIGERQEQDEESKRQRTAIIMRKSGFQITDAYLSREDDNSISSSLPAGINSLENHSNVNYLCSWKDVHRKQQRWLLNLKHNPERHATVSSSIRRNCTTKSLISLLWVASSTLSIHCVVHSVWLFVSPANATGPQHCWASGANFLLSHGGLKKWNKSKKKWRFEPQLSDDALWGTELNLCCFAVVHET